MEAGDASGPEDADGDDGAEGEAGADSGSSGPRRAYDARFGGASASAAPAAASAPTDVDAGWGDAPAAEAPTQQPTQRPEQPARDPRGPRNDRPRGARDERGGRGNRRDASGRRPEAGPRAPAPPRDDRQARDGRRSRDDRKPAAPPPDGPDDVAIEPRDPRDLRDRDPADRVPAQPPASTAPHPADDDDEPAPERNVAWGTDDDAPAPAIVLAPDLPGEDLDDPDPLTRPLVDAPVATSGPRPSGPGPGALGDDVACIAGVRFAVGGRVSWLDAGDADYRVGERVIVDTDRGPRLGSIAVAPAMRGIRDRNLRRVIRRATDADLGRDNDAELQTFLRAAKDAAMALRLPLKVFRVEGGRNRLLVYYTSDEQRLDVRDFVRTVSQATSARVELRQLGVRDEAKVIGGIGTCGLTLCCTTWLPDFVPVSIKMAKDQGLVLSPTKVSGQCGRLKCCLVYEQAAYAELRKGLPKLGKRVVSQRGEGRVVEVDVLRQRVRVSYGAGDAEVLPATEVKPLFPSQAQSAAPTTEPELDDDPDDPTLPSS